MKKILANHDSKLDELQEIVSKHGKDYILFIQYLETLGHLNVAVNLKNLDMELIGGIIDLSMPLYAPM